MHNILYIYKTYKIKISDRTEVHGCDFKGSDSRYRVGYISDERSRLSDLVVCHEAKFQLNISAFGYTTEERSFRFDHNVVDVESTVYI